MLCVTGSSPAWGNFFLLSSGVVALHHVVTMTEFTCMVSSNCGSAFSVRSSHCSSPYACTSCMVMPWSLFTVLSSKPAFLCLPTHSAMYNSLVLHLGDFLETHWLYTCVYTLYLSSVSIIYKCVHSKYIQQTKTFWQHKPAVMMLLWTIPLPHTLSCVYVVLASYPGVLRVTECLGTRLMWCILNVHVFATSFKGRIGSAVSSHLLLGKTSDYPLRMWGSPCFSPSTLQYKHGRELADFVKFLNDKCGTHRQPGGDLSPEVCKI